MANVQKYCPKGHAYDSSLPSCPFCLPVQGNVAPTTPANNQYGGNGGIVGSTTPVQQETRFTDDLISSMTDSNYIQSQPNTRVRPVVGWLVCVEGPDTGKDFRLHTDFNRVGRAEYQDVCLSDETVSREHFTIAHDRFNNQYFAEMNSNGRTMVHINGYSLGGRVVLERGDQIKVGKTLLVFIPLEQKDVKWNWKV